MVEITRAQIWGFVMLMAMVLAVMLRAARLALDPIAVVPGIILVIGLVALALYYPRLTSPRERRMAEVLESWGLFMAISAMGAMASYAVVAGTNGYHDAALAAIDTELGFDWLAGYHFLMSHPALARAAELAYLSIFYTPVIVLGALSASGRAARARTLILAFGLALIAALAIFHFLPARSALAYYLGTRPDYVPATGLYHLDVIDKLRSGALTTIDPRRMAGLITFPSFHAVSGLLFIWAAWPIRWLRVPCTAVNVAMLLATPIEGTHYLIDVIGGLLLAVLTLCMLHVPALAMRARSAAMRRHAFTDALSAPTWHSAMRIR